MSLATLTGSFAAVAGFSETKTVTGQSAIAFTPALNAAASFTAAGTTTAATANLATPLQYTITSSGTQTIDLTSITDPLLGSVTFARCKGLIIQHASTSAASSIKWNQSIANSLLGWFSGATGTPIITLLPGEWIGIGGASANGQTVDGTHKIITITNLDASNSATVNVFFVGADA